MDSVNRERRVRNSWELVATSAATVEIEEDVTIHAESGRGQHICENLLHSAIDHGGEGVTV
jgi:hypothetical protein